MKLFFIFLFLAGCSLQGIAQDTIHHRKAKNAIYIEAFGNSPYFTINYDRHLWKNRSWQTGIRFGIGADYKNLTYPKITPKPYMLSWYVPVEYYALGGKKRSFLELSLGYTFSTTKYLFPNYHLFYRQEPEPVQTSYQDIRIRQYTRGFIIGRIGYRFQSLKNGFILRAGLVFIRNQMWFCRANILVRHKNEQELRFMTQTYLVSV